jgi:hypothetical protein
VLAQPPYRFANALSLPRENSADIASSTTSCVKSLSTLGNSYADRVFLLQIDSVFQILWRRDRFL